MMFLTTGLTRFQQQTETNFSAKLHLRFLEAACRFSTTSWTRRMFLEFFRWFFGTFNGNGQQFECEWMRILFSFSAAITETAKLKQERHNTVHGA